MIFYLQGVILRKMYRAIKTIFLAFLFLTLLVSPLYAVTAKPPSANPEPVKDSYTLFYPVVAGKVEGESLYFLKRVRDKITEILAFSDERKSTVTLALATKKLLEAEKLLKEEKYEYANKAFNLFSDYLDSSYQHAVKAQEGDFVVDLFGEISNQTDKYLILLNQLKNKMPEEQKNRLLEILKKTEEIQQDSRQY